MSDAARIIHRMNLWLPNEIIEKIVHYFVEGDSLAGWAFLHRPLFNTWQLYHKCKNTNKELSIPIGALCCIDKSESQLIMKLMQQDSTNPLNLTSEECDKIKQYANKNFKEKILQDNTNSDLTILNEILNQKELPKETISNLLNIQKNLFAFDNALCFIVVPVGALILGFGASAVIFMSAGCCNGTLLFSSSFTIPTLIMPPTASVCLACAGAAIGKTRHPQYVPTKPLSI